MAPHSTARFTKINESFECLNCHFNVPQSESTCRDHCPKCLYSIHVDVFPGDRAAQCHGMLKPISYESHAKKGIVIEYKCMVCGEKKRNKFLERDKHCADSMDALLSLHKDRL